LSDINFDGGERKESKIKENSSDNNPSRKIKRTPLLDEDGTTRNLMT
jgi:hypothetical protein